MGTLLGISPVVKRGLVSAVRDIPGNPVQASHKQSGTTVLTVGQGASQRTAAASSVPSRTTKNVNFATARDDLLRVKVQIGDTETTAIVDTGSQLNLISESVFCKSGLARTEESVVVEFEGLEWAFGKLFLYQWFAGVHLKVCTSRLVGCLV